MKNTIAKVLLSIVTLPIGLIVGMLCSVIGALAGLFVPYNYMFTSIWDKK